MKLFLVKRKTQMFQCIFFVLIINTSNPQNWNREYESYYPQQRFKNDNFDADFENWNESSYFSAYHALHQHDCNHDNGRYQYMSHSNYQTDNFYKGYKGTNYNISNQHNTFEYEPYSYQPSYPTKYKSGTFQSGFGSREGFFEILYNRIKFPSDDTAPFEVKNTDFEFMKSIETNNYNTICNDEKYLKKYDKHILICKINQHLSDKYDLNYQNLYYKTLHQSQITLKNHLRKLIYDIGRKYQEYMTMGCEKILTNKLILILENIRTRGLNIGRILDLHRFYQISCTGIIYELLIIHNISIPLEKKNSITSEVEKFFEHIEKNYAFPEGEDVIIKSSTPKAVDTTPYTTHEKDLERSILVISEIYSQLMFESNPYYFV